MLKTCLKYDLRAIGRIWCIIAAAMGGASVVAGAGIRLFIEVNGSNSNNVFLSLLSIATMFAAVMCIIGLFVAVSGVMILVFWRLYTHFYTDQGYLTFTLPVKRSTLYLSKVISGTIFEVATFLILLLGIGVILLFAIPPEAVGENTMLGMLGAYGRVLVDGIIRELGWWLLIWIPLILVFLVAVLLAGNGLMFLCITIGSIVAKKHKLLAAIGIYYLVNAGVSFILQILSMFLVSGLVGSLEATVNAGKTIGCVTVTAALLIACAAAGSLAMVYHFMTVSRLERKLNLA